MSRYGSLKHDYPFSSYVCNRNQQDTQEGFGLSIFSPVLTSLDFNNQNTFSLRDDVQKKIVKRVTSYIFQITPSLLALRMTSERMTNHNNQWVPPSLRKEWQINVLKRFQRGQRDLHFGWFYSNIFHFPWNKEWGMRFGQKREFSFPKS